MQGGIKNTGALDGMMHDARNGEWKSAASAATQPKGASVFSADLGFYDNPGAAAASWLFNSAQPMMGYSSNDSGSVSSSGVWRPSSLPPNPLPPAPAPWGPPAPNPSSSSSKGPFYPPWGPPAPNPSSSSSKPVYPPWGPPAPNPSSSSSKPVYPPWGPPAPNPSPNPAPWGPPAPNPSPNPAPAPVPAPPQHDAIVPPPPYIPYTVVGPVSSQCDFSTPFFCSTQLMGGATPAVFNGGVSTPYVPAPLSPGDVFQWFNNGQITPEMMEAGYNFGTYGK